MDIYLILFDVAWIIDDGVIEMVMLHEIFPLFIKAQLALLQQENSIIDVNPNKNGILTASDFTQSIIMKNIQNLVCLQNMLWKRLAKFQEGSMLILKIRAKWPSDPLWG